MEEQPEPEIVSDDEVPVVVFVPNYDFLKPKEVEKVLN